MRSRLGLLSLLALASSLPVLRALPELNKSNERLKIRRDQNDEIRLAKAEAKRQRKAAKRLK